MYSITCSATAHAHDSYIHILEVLDEQWGIDKAYEFDVKTFKLLDSLALFKNLCPPSKTNPTLRKCTVSKYTALVYRIDDVLKQIRYNSLSIAFACSCSGFRFNTRPNKTFAFAISCRCKCIAA